MLQYKYQNNRPTVAYIYNPQNQSKDELIVSFVVRLKIFKKLFAEIKSSTMKHPEQHFLIEGKRGMGKTTLLLRLAYEIENDDKLSKWLIPLVFNEEEYSVRKLFKFWERIAEILEEKAAEFQGLRAELEALSKTYKSDDDYEKACFELITSQLQKHEKKIILFIDNFGDMFRKFKEKEAHRLRKILQTSADLRIFAASSVVLEAFYDYSHPFYEFFKVEQLEGLDAAQTRELLLKLGKVYKQEEIVHIVQNQKGRVEALRRLTGGVIRTIILLFEIFVDNEDGNAFRDLETILDRVTPLYKHRMDDLPPPQQEIVEAIALSWDAISVREIAEKTRMESKVISAQLNQLVKNDIIHKIRTNTKNNLYQISERFFNIWYLMRHGRNGDSSKVIWLVRFLEEWCNELEIVDRAKMHISHLQNGKYDTKAAYLMSQALAFTRNLPQDTQHALIDTTRKFLTAQNSELVKDLSKSDVELFQNTLSLINGGQFAEALDLALKMKQKHFLLIGLLYESLDLFEKAEDAYLQAIENQERSAHYFLASFYHSKLKAFKKAEKHYLKAIEKGDEGARYALGTVYLEKKYFPKAIEQFQLAKKEGSLDAALMLASTSISISKNYEKAETMLREALTDEEFYDEQFLTSRERLKLISNGLVFLIARKQYDFLLSFFNSEKAGKLYLKERFKPVYYALMYFLQEQFPNEYLRMGKELKQTVEEIILQIQKMEEVYA